MSGEVRLRSDGRRPNKMAYGALVVRAKKRLKDRSILQEVTGCIEYTEYLNEFGYGRLRFNGKKWLAHRLAWYLENGEIPKGLLVCHTCDNPKCINIEHLFLGTDLDNVRDAIKKGRMNPSERSKNRWVKCPTFRKN